jgi:hypothetical protein
MGPHYPWASSLPLVLYPWVLITHGRRRPLRLACPYMYMYMYIYIYIYTHGSSLPMESSTSSLGMPIYVFAYVLYPWALITHGRRRPLRLAC